MSVRTITCTTKLMSNEIIKDFKPVYCTASDLKTLDKHSLQNSASLPDIAKQKELS